MGRVFVVGEEGVERGAAGFGGAVPGRGGGRFGLALRCGERAGPDFVRIDRVEIVGGERFGGQVLHALGEGIERGLARGEERLLAGGLRGCPLRGAFGIVFRGREGGFAAGEQLGKVIGRLEKPVALEGAA